jgi:hypothetical protein
VLQLQPIDSLALLNCNHTCEKKSLPPGLLKVPVLMSIISGCTEKKRSLPVSGMLALLAKINAGVMFENKQFSKIISVALYVKMGEAMWGVKIRQADLAMVIECSIFAPAFLLWWCAAEDCVMLIPNIGTLFYGIPLRNFYCSEDCVFEVAIFRKKVLPLLRGYSLSIAASQS